LSRRRSLGEIKRCGEPDPTKDSRCWRSRGDECAGKVTASCIPGCLKGRDFLNCRKGVLVAMKPADWGIEGVTEYAQCHKEWMQPGRGDAQEWWDRVHLGDIIKARTMLPLPKLPLGADSTLGDAQGGSQSHWVNSYKEQNRTLNQRDWFISKCWD
jgi:hypothetical protein